MEIIVNQMEHKVRAIDGQALLHPTILNSITDAAVARMKECLHHERVVSQERKLRPALTSREVTFWE